MDSPGKCAFRREEEMKGDFDGDLRGFRNLGGLYHELIADSYQETLASNEITIPSSA